MEIRLGAASRKQQEWRCRLSVGFLFGIFTDIVAVGQNGREDSFFPGVRTRLERLGRVEQAVAGLGGGAEGVAKNGNRSTGRGTPPLLPSDAWLCRAKWSFSGREILGAILRSRLD
jgi:hypothetical protein